MTVSIMPLSIMALVLLCWMSFMLSVENEPFMLRVNMLSVIMLNIVVPLRVLSSNTKISTCGQDNSSGMPPDQKVNKAEEQAYLFINIVISWYGTIPKSTKTITSNIVWSRTFFYTLSFRTLGHLGFLQSFSHLGVLVS